jgi:hypothetical protein
MGNAIEEPRIDFPQGPNDANTSRLPYYDPSLRCPVALWVVWLDEVTIATITCPPTFSATVFRRIPLSRCSYRRRIVEIIEFIDGGLCQPQT